MLTGFTMAVPIPHKNCETICDAYRDHIYCTFGGSSRILTDNGSEFKNKEMQQVCEILGVKHVFSLQCTHQNQMDVWKDGTDFSKHVLQSTSKAEELNGMN